MEFAKGHVSMATRVLLFVGGLVPSVWLPKVELSRCKAFAP